MERSVDNAGWKRSVQELSAQIIFGAAGNLISIVEAIQSTIKERGRQLSRRRPQSVQLGNRAFRMGRWTDGSECVARVSWPITQIGSGI